VSRGVYTVEFNAQDQTAADGNMDMFELRPSSSAGMQIALIGVHIDNTSEVGDAQEEMISYSLIRMTGATFTSGTGGTTPTPVATDFNDVAASFAADAVNDVVATTTGTTATPISRGFNLRTGLDLWLPAEDWIVVPGVANAAIIVRFNTTVADTVTWQGTAWVKEGM
jgi:hypothetical protein